MAGDGSLPIFTGAVHGTDAGGSMKDGRQDDMQIRKTDESKTSVGAGAAFCVKFHVPGLPVAKGNLKTVPIRRADGTPTTRMIESQHVTGWVATVRTAAAAAYGDRPPLEGPVFVAAVFRFPRPKSHFRGNKPGPGRLRLDAPKYVITRPDRDKLERAIMDAMQGVIFRDDAQVAVGMSAKVYANDGEVTGVKIMVIDAEQFLLGCLDFPDAGSSSG